MGHITCLSIIEPRCNMNFNLYLINGFLIAFVGISAAKTLWNVTRVHDPQYNRGWVIVSIFTASVLGLAYLIIPEWAGWVGFGVWLIVGIVPPLGMRYAWRLINAERFDAGIRLQQFIRLLHPFDYYRDLPEIMRESKLEAAGDMDGASEILRRYTDHPQWRYYATTQLFRRNKQYEALLNWLRANYKDADYRRDPTLLGPYLQAVAKASDLNVMLSEFDRLKATVEHLPRELIVDYLIVFANCGRDAPVRVLLEGALAYFPEDLKLLWLAHTDFAAGRVSEGQQRLVDILQTSQKTYRRNAARLQEDPPPIASEILTAESLERLARLEQDYKQVQQSIVPGAVTGKAAILTWILIALNVLAFLVEMQQGSAESLETLYTLGALWTPAVTEGGEWWRVVTATFLHYGVAHLALNMLVLYSIGRTVEARIGSLRYLIVYLASGVGSSLAVLALIQRNVIYVGASGAIMGLVGAAAAMALHAWRASKGKAARGELFNALLIVGLQVAMKFIVPQVSLEGHLAGAAIGFIVAFALLIPRRVT
jgi:rhomboid protease GluP